MAITPYRAPAIALVQPTPGTALQQDKAIVIFRFAQGEASDPLDASSFSVSVNGSNRTGLFQVASAEAWGPLSDVRALAPGAYQLTARICSTHGACALTTATVNVAPSESTPAGTAAENASRRQRLIDLLLSGARRLLGP